MQAALFRHLSALSEPTRVRLLHALAREELGVGELARVLQSPQSTVSRHLKHLRTEGWLEKRAEGTASFFRLAEPLPEGAGALWAVVARDLRGSGLYAEDLRRVDSVLAQREMDSRAFFGRHADQWEQVRRELFGEKTLLPALLSLLPAGLVVADLGCGTGEAVEALAPYVARAIGVDREAAMLSAARARLEKLENGGPDSLNNQDNLNRIVLLEGGLEALPLADRELDAALCSLVLHHVEDLPAAFSEIARCLKPGGRLIVLDMADHDRREYRRTMGHRHLGFSEDTLAALAADADLTLTAWRRLPADPEAQGPGLFVAVLTART